MTPEERAQKTIDNWGLDAPKLKEAIVVAITDAVAEQRRKDAEIARNIKISAKTGYWSIYGEAIAAAIEAQG